MEKITGKIIKILNLKENGWGRFKIECSDGREITSVGIIKDAVIGATASLTGYIENTEYGRQFTIKNSSIKCDEFAGIRRFLTDGYIKGLGLVKAEMMIRKFGKDSLKMIETEEGRKKLCEIKGLGEKSVKKIYESYLQSEKYKDIVLFLNGIETKNQIEKIFNLYGEKSVKEIKTNPYRLQKIEGFGFKKVDALAMAGGIKPNSPYRITAAAMNVIEEASYNDGHCFVPVNILIEKIIELLVPVPVDNDISNTKIKNAMKDWDKFKEKFIKENSPSGELLININDTLASRDCIMENLNEALMSAFDSGELINEDGDVYLKSLFDAEIKSSDIIKDMLSKHPVRYIKQELLETCITEIEKRKTDSMRENKITGEFCFTAEQISAVRLGLMQRFSVISGGPGRGKTAICELIAYTFLKSGTHYDEEDVIMLAPTGRAAQRITESTGYSSMTIHRAVMSKDKPVGKLIIVDESSMIDIYLMKKLLEYGKECNIILVGDVNQIASVGPGKVLKDLIESGKVPYIILKEGHRNTGTIAHNSELINNGERMNKYVYDKNFVYTPITKENAVDVLLNDYIKKVKEYGIENVMLCAAMRERGSASVKALNQSLQDRFTKGQKEARFGELLFRVGDRVMQIKNDYNFRLKKEGDIRLGIFNGERGTVNKIIFDEDNEEYKVVVKFDDGSIGGYTRQTIFNLTLAYATTLHKCQGSEAACMMMIYTFGDYMLLKRSLFYTGETRAKKEFRFYGEEKRTKFGMWSAFDIAVKNIDDTTRNTKLAKRL